MDRGATSGVIDELNASQNQPVHLIQVIFDDETLYLTDAYIGISWGGNDYLGAGKYISFTSIKETSELQVNEITGQFTAADESRELMTAFFTKDYIDRQMIIYKAFLDSSFQAIADPILIFDGRMNKPSIREDPDKGTSVIQVTATNQWVDFERRPGRHTNHEEQQIHFPGDKGFEYASQITKEILWGRK